jgi:hypothetical protein
MVDVTPLPVPAPVHLLVEHEGARVLLCALLAVTMAGRGRRRYRVDVPPPLTRRWRP